MHAAANCLQHIHYMPRYVQEAISSGLPSDGMNLGAGLKAENMLLDKSGPPNVKISSVGYYKATLDTVPKSKVGSFGFVGALHCQDSYSMQHDTCFLA